MKEVKFTVGCAYTVTETLREKLPWNVIIVATQWHTVRMAGLGEGMAS